MTDRSPAAPPPVPQQATAAPGSGDVPVEASSGLHFALAFRPNTQLPVYTETHTLSNDRVFGGGGGNYATRGLGGRRCYGLDRRGEPAFGFPIAFRFDTHRAGVAHVEAYERSEDAVVVPFQVPGLPAGTLSVSDPILTVIRLSNERAAPGSGSRPANIASIAIFMHGIQSGVGGSSAAPVRNNYWSDLPHSSPSRLAELLQNNVRASFEILLFACLTAAEPHSHDPGPASYASRLAEALIPYCAERVRVFGHTTAEHYAENGHGYEYVSENGGALVGRSNREVCLPDAFLLDAERITRLAAATGRTEDYLRANIVSSADAWMHGPGGRVREVTVDGETQSLGAEARYAIGYKREATISVIQAAWDSPNGAEARLRAPAAGARNQHR